MKKSIMILAVLLSLGLFSCKTTDINDIPQDLTAAQLLQAGQNCESTNRYKEAEEYFKATIQRYGLDNALYVEARYELGNCYLKEKEYSKAELCFQEIIQMYEDSEVGMLPPQYLKLAEIGLAKIK